MKNMLEKNQDKIIFITKIILIFIGLLMSLPILNHYLYNINKISSIWLLSIFGFLIFTKKIRFKNKENVLLMILCIFYFITIFKNGRNHFLNEIIILIYMIVSCFVFTYCNEKKEKEEVLEEIIKIAWLTVVITFIFSCINLILYIYDTVGYIELGENRLFYNNVGGKIGGIYNPNTGATLNYISMVFSYIIYTILKKRNVFLFLNIVIQGISLILSQSRGAWMSFMFFVLMSFLLLFIEKKHITSRKTKLIAGTMVITCIVFGIYSIGSRYGIFEMEEISFDLAIDWNSISSGRIELWKVALQAYEDVPILGIGYRNIDDVLKAGLFENQYYNVIAGGLHNIYVTILVSSGIVGFTTLLIYFSLLLKMVFKLLFNSEISNEIKLFSLFIPTLLIGEIVESRIVFGMNCFAILFWITAGYINYFSKKED